MTDSDPIQHLPTRYVFIDTEAFRKARFDWTGKTLSKLVEFARRGHSRLLTTEVTKHEVVYQLREVLADAAEAVKKHEILLRQTGAGEALTTIADTDTAIAALDAAFEKFLKDTKAIEVPLSADLSALFGDYFARRPPFSTKKKSEFPDAVTIASLLAWCAEKDTTAYVVSGDRDLKACCSQSGPLLYAASVGDIISQATVSRELREALEKVLCANDRLTEELADQIKNMELVPVHGSFRGNQGRVVGKIDDVDEIKIHYVNVLDQDGEEFSCEIEFEANLILNLNIEIEGRYHGYDDYERGRFFTTHESIWHVFGAEFARILSSRQSTFTAIASS
jgi:predicted nucleic acid-binding protein